MTKENLLEFLDNNRIPYQTWGKGSAKTVDDLLQELNEDASVLVVNEREEVIRKSYGVIIDVFYRDATVLFKLRESKQVFADGRVRKRNLEHSVSEKIKKGEVASQTAKRGLCEGLGIIENLPIKLLGPRFLGPVPSDSFPGTITEYTMFLFEFFMPHRHFVSEGYVEIQENKTTYFHWEKLSGHSAVVL